MQNDSGSLAELGELLRTRFGLLPLHGHGLERLSEVFSRLQSESQRSPASLLRWLSGRKDTDPIWREIVDTATTGETHLFREREQFVLLGTHILPALVERREAIRIWSAATSTGAEAWSAAFSLLDVRLGCARGGDRVLGTDIDEIRLEQARRGEYGTWAFREIAASDLPGRFLRSGRIYTVRPPKGLRVDFSFHNLLSLSPPDSGSEDGRFDVVLCRNVLMYLEPERVESVILSLASAVHEDGYILAAPCEQHLFDRVLESERVGGNLLFRGRSRAAGRKIRTLRKGREGRAPRSRRRPSPRKPERRVGPTRRSGLSPTSPTPQELTPMEVAEQDLKDVARTFAAGEGRKGQELLRRVLYRDPENLTALVLQCSHGTTARSRVRAAKTALNLLAHRSEQENLPELDHAPTAEVRSFLQAMLDGQSSGGHR